MRVANITEERGVDCRNLGNIWSPFLEVNSRRTGLSGPDQPGPKRTLSEMQTVRFLPDSKRPIQSHGFMPKGLCCRHFFLTFFLGEKQEFQTFSFAYFNL